MRITLHNYCHTLQDYDKYLIKLPFARKWKFTHKKVNNEIKFIPFCLLLFIIFLLHGAIYSKKNQNCNKFL